METMQIESVAEGKPPLPSAEVVSKVLSQNSSNTTFLKNAGIATPSPKPQSAGEKLAAEIQGSAVLQQELEELKKKTDTADEAPTRTQIQYEELKKQ
jgi:hypothetical protein